LGAPAWQGICSRGTINTGAALEPSGVEGLAVAKAKSTTKEPISI
jgi:hypothetical protein